MAWVVRIRSSVTDVELISSTLWDHGPSGISELHGRADDEPGSTDDVAGRHQLRCELTAGYSDATTATAALESIRQLCRRGFVATDGVEATIEQCEATWEGPTASVIEVGSLSLRIDAGPTFGHGRHPTTAMALELAVRLVEPGAAVLDVGTGSGILAIAAALAGAGSVTAIDLDPEALVRARSNAVDNGVELVVSDRPVTGIDRRFDLVLANLLLADLEPIADALVERCAEGARLVSTGFLVEQQARVEELLRLPVTDRLERGGWAALVLRR